MKLMAFIEFKGIITLFVGMCLHGDFYHFTVVFRGLKEFGFSVTFEWLKGKRKDFLKL